MFLYMFLEETKLNDNSSNDADWVRDLRFILIAAQKNYVLDAPLGERPVAGAEADVMNVWQARSDDYSLVQCGMLYALESGVQRCFERHGPYEMFQDLKLIFQQIPELRDMKSPTSSRAKRWRRIAQAVSMCSDCLGTTIAWIKWELIFQIR